MENIENLYDREFLDRIPVSKKKNMSTQTSRLREQVEKSIRWRKSIPIDSIN